MVKIPQSLQKELAKKSVDKNKKEVSKPFEKKFNELRQQMISEFLSHPVTIEILAGPNNRTSRVSGTLSGKANLFSFIGFSSEDNPIEPIIELLESTSYKQTKDGFKITLPTAADIFKVTPMPWASGRSWAKGIESGISGLGYLLNKRSSSSRSGSAFQNKKRVRSDNFKKVPYISSLINKYKKEFKKIK